MKSSESRLGLYTFFMCVIPLSSGSLCCDLWDSSPRAFQSSSHPAQLLHTLYIKAAAYQLNMVDKDRQSSPSFSQSTVGGVTAHEVKLKFAALRDDDGADFPFSLSLSSRACANSFICGAFAYFV